MNRKDQIAEFLARKGATICPPAESFEDQAAPLSRARRAHERVVFEREHGRQPADDGDPEVREVEKAVKQRLDEIQWGRG
jgi:hypothetical protein